MSGSIDRLLDGDGAWADQAADPARRAALREALLMAARLRRLEHSPDQDPVGALVDGRLDAVALTGLLVEAADPERRRELARRLRFEAALARAAAGLPPVEAPQERLPSTEHHH